MSALLGAISLLLDFCVSTRLADQPPSRNRLPPRFAEQCALILAGKPLIDNGPRPAVEEDEDEEEVCAGMGDIDIPGADDY